MRSRSFLTGVTIGVILWGAGGGGKSLRAGEGQVAAASSANVASAGRPSSSEGGEGMDVKKEKGGESSKEGEGADKPKKVRRRPGAQPDSHCH